MIWKTGTLLSPNIHAPDPFSQCLCFPVDATIKGLSTPIDAYDCAAASHDEAAGVHDADDIPTARGAHTSPKHRMSNYTQCESVDTPNGAGSVHLTSDDNP